MSDAPSDKTATIPTRLRAAREAAGLSQGQVAKLMNMHRPTISEMEAGNRRITADELAKLADLYTTDIAVRERFSELGRQFNVFKEELERQSPGVDIEIDSAKLFLAVTSYFIDVARYKWWHFPFEPEKARLDGTKKSAFMAYWLNKLSPVSARRRAGSPPMIDPNGLPTDPSVMANPYFTIFIVMNYLDFVLSDELTSKLLYHMLWRDESSKSYMLLFEMLDSVHRGGNLFVKASP